MSDFLIVVLFAWAESFIALLLIEYAILFNKSASSIAASSLTLFAPDSISIFFAVILLIDILNHSIKVLKNFTLLKFTMKKLKIRKISYEDIPELSKIISEIYLELPYVLTFNKKPSKLFLHELLSKKIILSNNNKILDFIALNKKNKIMAECEIIPNIDKDYSGIIGIIVKKDFRHIGVGKELLWYCIKMAIKLNLKYLSATISKKNKPAILFFKKNGFKKKRENSKQKQDKINNDTIEVILRL